MRKICVITGTRAEYGLLYWLMKGIEASEKLQLQLVVTGMHLSPEFGLTYKEIEQEFRIDKKITEGTLGEKGSGFGIIICLDMLKQMKSKLLFTSQECHGTTFWFYLKKK